ncbi:hypothetical protein [Streptomyces chattanoogensis]|uniref:hypothetical protein n=1 Tax=Streptomyces chattanoogensis TaxID=66876 RepID=UPI0036AB9348
MTRRIQKSLTAAAIALGTLGAAAVAVMGGDSHIPSAPSSTVVAQDHHIPLAAEETNTSLTPLDSHIP